LEGGASREGWKTGLGVAGRDTSKDQWDRKHVLGWLVAVQSKCCVPRPHKGWESCIGVWGVKVGQLLGYKRVWPGWMVSRGLVQSVKEHRG